MAPESHLPPILCVAQVKAFSMRDDPVASWEWGRGVHDSNLDTVWPPIAALIFDMDGLLVDSEPASEAALRQFLQAHGHELSLDTVTGALGRRLPEAIAVVAEVYALPGALDELVAVFDALRLEALRGAIVAMPGASAVLDWAAANGIPCALATSSFRHQAEVALAEAGLAGRFDVEVTGDEVERGKPEPDLFLLAARRLGVAPEACVVFEDAPAGLEAAARAGMRRIWVPNAHTWQLTPTVSVDVTLESLAQAAGWLASRGAGQTATTAIPAEG
jgi:HAD superfamily hydrolase (TIGR01509 family)